MYIKALWFTKLKLAVARRSDGPSWAAGPYQAVELQTAGNQVSYSGRSDHPPGAYRLEAEFVAVDHGPFDPPVTASVTFRVVPP